MRDIGVRNYLFIMLLIILSFGSTSLLAQSGGYIDIRQSHPNTLNYILELNAIKHKGSTVQFGGFEVSTEMDYLRNGDEDTILYIPISKNFIINRYRKEFAFPGPGTYRISARTYNRTGGITNMTNSVNTPFFVSTTFTLDPYIGLNLPPVIKPPIFMETEPGSPYIFPPNIKDPDNDSLSFKLVIPRQDKDNFVAGYQFPNKSIPDGGAFSIDPFTGTVRWSNPYKKGAFVVAMEISEWRKVNGELLKIGSTILDWIMIFRDNQNKAPIIDMPKYLVVNPGNKINWSADIYDPDKDTISVTVSGHFSNFMSNPVIIQSDSILVAEARIEIQVSSSKSFEEAQPYSVFVTATDDELQSISKTDIWITEGNYKPNAPSNLSAFTDGIKIILEWDDNSENEVGFILERADDNRPDYHYYAALPADLTWYHDAYIESEKEYSYRLTAVGSTLSDISNATNIRLGLLTGTQDNSSMVFKVSPNPANNTIHVIPLQQTPVSASLRLYNLLGEMVFEDKIQQKKGPFLIDTSIFKPGMYILHYQNSHSGNTLPIIIQH